MNRVARDAAFVEFVAANQRHLRRIAYAICGDWVQAEDLVQTALVKLYVAWPRMQRSGREVAYCRTIIMRANIDEHRRPSSRERPGLDGHDQHARAEDLTDRTALFDALRGLPVMQRKVVVLRHLLGLSVVEAAAELGISEGTVKSHSSRGLAALRAVLATADV